MLGKFKIIIPDCSTITTDNNNNNNITNQPTRRKTHNLQVLYNPLKGMHFIHEILKQSENMIQFTPIGGGIDGREQISPEEVSHAILY